MAKKVPELLTMCQNKSLETCKPWFYREFETLLKLIERNKTSWTDQKVMWRMYLN